MIQRQAEPRGDVTVSEPFPEYAWPEVWGWMRDIRNRIVDDFGPQTLSEFVTWALRMSERSRTWGVWREGELGGLIVFARESPMMGATHVVFRKSFWGPTTTLTALHAVYRQVFDSGITKICGVVFKDNHAVRALARRGGGREEGVLTGQTMRGGKPVDMVMLGMTREEFEFYGTDHGDRITGGNVGQLGGGKNQHGDDDTDLHAGADGSAEHAGEHLRERPDQRREHHADDDLGRQHD
jgi:RimJ/RimL family protein N-acetyltransferase